MGPRWESSGSGGSGKRWCAEPDRHPAHRLGHHGRPGADGRAGGGQPRGRTGWSADAASGKRDLGAGGSRGDASGGGILMRTAVVDIGTNSTRLLVADVED